MWNQFCLLLPSSVQVKLHLGQFKITSLDDPSWSIYFSHHLKFLFWMSCPAPFQTLLPCIIQVTEISSQWPCPRKQAITYLVLAAVGIKEGIANLNSPGSPSWLTAGSELYLPEARCDLYSDCTAPFVWARTGCGWREAGLAHCPAPGAQPARHRVMLSVPEQSCFNLPALLLPPWGVCGTSVSQRAGLVLHPRLGACRTLQEVSWGKVSWAWSVRRGKIRRVCRARSPPPSNAAGGNAQSDSCFSFLSLMSQQCSALPLCSSCCKLCFLWGRSARECCLCNFVRPGQGFRRFRAARKWYPLLVHFLSPSANQHFCPFSRSYELHTLMA